MSNDSFIDTGRKPSMRNPQKALTLPAGQRTTNLADCNISGVKKITVGKNCNAVPTHAKVHGKKPGITQVPSSSRIWVQTDAQK